MRKSIATVLCLVALAAGSATQAHEVKSPRDAASGLATGKRMHKPFVITMSWSSQADASSYCSSVSGEMKSTTSGRFACTVEDRSQAAADARALGCSSGACPSSAPPLMVSKATPKLMETCASGASCASSSTGKATPKLSTQTCGSASCSATAGGGVTHEDSWEKPVVK